MWLTGRIAIKAETTQCRTGLETSLGASMTTWRNLARLRKQYDEYGRIIKDAHISGE
jgi:hypothetical protein